MSGEGFDPRGAEMRLIGQISNQIESLGDNFRDFTDKMTQQMLDVRERLARIEASSGESSRELSRLDKDISKLHDENGKLKDAHSALVSRTVRMETIIAPLTVLGGALASGLVTLLATKVF